MTVILMLTMFVVFLTIDYFMRKGKVTTTVEAEEAGVQTAPRTLPTIVSGFELPVVAVITRGEMVRRESRRRRCAWAWMILVRVWLERSTKSPCRRGASGSAKDRNSPPCTATVSR